MEYHDKVLKCAECGAEFVFTAGEQMFFADKGFKNEPKRCKSPSAQRRDARSFAASASSSAVPWAPLSCALVFRFRSFPGRDHFYASVAQVLFVFLSLYFRSQ